MSWRVVEIEGQIIIKTERERWRVLWTRAVSMEIYTDIHADIPTQ